MKRFTLIELIVVIAVLSLLASIVTLNIGKVKPKALQATALSEISVLQSAIDRYVLDHNGEIPTLEKPTYNNPQSLVFDKLVPDYIVKKSKLPFKFWIDYNNQVWISEADLPIKLTYNNGTVSWENAENAIFYNLYLYKKSPGSAAVNNKSMQLIKQVQNNQEKVMQVTNLPLLQENEEILVQTVDQYGLSSPIGGKDYFGYQNTKPVIDVRYSPSENLTIESVLHWEVVDLKGDSVAGIEWKVDESTVSEGPATFEIPGSHHVSVRIQNDKGIWSDWVEVVLNVTDTPAPVANLSYTPNTGINVDTIVTWNLTNDTSRPITKKEWKVDGSPVANPPSVFDQIKTYTVEARIQDDRGKWSDWKTVSIPVSGTPFVAFSQNFDYTGVKQTISVPTTGTYKIEVWGAAGGNSVYGDLGGKGGYTAGTIFLKKGDSLHFYVGGRGTDGKGNNGGGDPGWNGGGRGGDGVNNGYYYTPGAGGGGATDVRLNTMTLNDRIIVAGGGGGSAYSGQTGGAGGGLVGGSPTGSTAYIPQGGTQTSGGDWKGTFGQGGNGEVMTSGGGGGGWYGGGSNFKYTWNSSADRSSGAGGSSYFDKMINNSTRVMQQGIWSGNGKAVITRVS